jgi:hypothetical protein
MQKKITAAATGGILSSLGKQNGNSGQMEKQLLDGCRRLARRGLFNGPADSFSMRIPGSMEMILAYSNRVWLQIGVTCRRTLCSPKRA